MLFFRHWETFYIHDGNEKSPMVSIYPRYVKYIRFFCLLFIFFSSFSHINPTSKSHRYWYAEKHTQASGYGKMLRFPFASKECRVYIISIKVSTLAHLINLRSPRRIEKGNREIDLCEARCVSRTITVESTPVDN